MTPRIARAQALQARLRRRVRIRGGPRRVKLVAGADLAYRGDGSRAWAAVVLWSLHDGAVVETVTASGRPSFPYVPGYLSFREGPLLLRVNLSAFVVEMHPSIEVEVSANGTSLTNWKFCCSQPKTASRQPVDPR